MIEPTKPVRQISTWFSGLIVVVCLAGGAALVWWSVSEAGTGERIIVLDRGIGDGVVKAAADTWEVNSNGAQLRAKRDRAGKFELAFKFTRYDFFTQEDIDTLTAVQTITDSDQFIKELGLSPRQVERLDALRARAKIQIDPADQERLSELLAEYVEVEKPANKAEREAGWAASSLAELRAEARRLGIEVPDDDLDGPRGRGPGGRGKGSRGKGGRGGWPGGRDPAAEASAEESESAEPDPAEVERVKSELAKLEAEAREVKERAEETEEARRAAEEPLLEAVDELAERLRGPYAEDGPRRAEEARGVLSAEQWEQFKKRREPGRRRRW